MAQVGKTKLAEFQSVIYRIIGVIGTFTCDESGGIESGDTASLDFDVEVNGSTKFSFSIDYDENTETDLTYDSLVSSVLSSGEDAKIQPGDKIKIQMTENFGSGYSFSYDDVNITLLCSKIYF